MGKKVHICSNGKSLTVLKAIFLVTYVKISGFRQILVDKCPHKGGVYQN